MTATARRTPAAGHTGGGRPALTVKAAVRNTVNGPRTNRRGVGTPAWNAAHVLTDQAPRDVAADAATVAGYFGPAGGRAHYFDYVEELLNVADAHGWTVEEVIPVLDEYLAKAAARVRARDEKTRVKRLARWSPHPLTVVAVERDGTSPAGNPAWLVALTDPDGYSSIRRTAPNSLSYSLTTSPDDNYSTRDLFGVGAVVYVQQDSKRRLTDLVRPDSMEGERLTYELQQAALAASKQPA